MAQYLVTGAAGFIAARVAEMLLAQGHTVVGIDNLNDYYDVRIKDHRLTRLLGKPGAPSNGNPLRSQFSGPGQLNQATAILFLWPQTWKTSPVPPQPNQAR